jgi:hypothetical protein
MTFIPNGYVNEALEFDSSNNQMLTVPYIPLSWTSFTVDVWLYISQLVGTNDRSIFGLCFQVAQFQCLYLSIHENNGNYYLYFGFYEANCQGVTSLTTNTWIHAAFVFDLTTLTQYIYLNGVLENSCAQSSALNVTTTAVTIGYVEQLNFLYFDVNDFQSDNFLL